jgi:UDP-N-acetylenolpyruvoylglucosamine reductase
MNMSEQQKFSGTALRGKLLRNVPMRKYTSWRTGGAAERMYQPADLDDLLLFLRGLPADEPLYPVGLGSNLLVRDGGLRGTVLMLHGTLSGLHLELDGSVYAEAGVPGAKLARFAAQHDLQDAEFFAGIPGTAWCISEPRRITRSATVMSR